MTASTALKKRRTVGRKALLKAVSTSTAVETGKPSHAIEVKLRSGKSRFKSLPLA